MKRTIQRILAFLTAVLLCLPAYAEPLSVSAPGVDAMQLSGLTVRWQKQKNCYTLIASWNDRGDAWEACMTGLPQKLTDAQVSLLLSAAVQGQKAALTGDGLIDAEKASNKLPLSYGDKLITDAVSGEDQWGDSLHCWAAAVSNMLVITGWIDSAAEPDTGRKFTDTDDLFGYFNRSFINDGSHFSAALNWIFDGTVLEELAMPREGTQGPLIRGAVDRTPYLDLRVDKCESVEQYMQLMTERLQLLKQGAAIGTSVSICPIEYPLKSDPNITASHDDAMNAFVRYDLCSVPWSEVTEMLFVPDAQNGLAVPVTADETSGRYYEAGSGREVDPNDVWIGSFVYDDEQDLWFAIDETSYFDEEKDPQYFRIGFYGEDELDLEHPIERPAFGGQHALTVTGYVMNLSEADPAARIHALLLADSDNDAKIFRPDQSSMRREDRPNTYTLYPAEVINTEHGKTVSLKGYLPNDQVLLYSLTVLMPAPNAAPPQTGDAFPAVPCMAVLLLSALVLLRIFRKRPGTGSHPVL